MSGTLIVLPGAERDLDEAVEWYDARQYGVGRRLARAFRDCSRSIADYPESFAIVHGDFQLAMLKFFPYGVYFRTTSEAPTSIESSIRLDTRTRGAANCRSKSIRQRCGLPRTRCLACNSLSSYS